jgi:hypothetical protein
MRPYLPFRPFLPYLAGAGATLGFDFYVDSILGSDLNAGTSENIPFATLSAVSTAMNAASGTVSIGIKAGSLLRERITLKTGTSIGAYGTGGDPVISPVDNPQTGWTLVGSEYQRSHTYDPKNVFVRGSGWDTSGIIRLAKGTFGSLTEGQWGWNGTNTLSVRLTGDVVPTLVEIPQNSIVAAITMAPSCSLSNIRFLMNIANGIQINTNAHDCTLSSCESSYNGGDGIGLSDAQRASIIGCTIIDNGDDGRTASSGDGVSTHSNCDGGRIIGGYYAYNRKGNVTNTGTGTFLIDGLTSVYPKAGVTGSKAIWFTHGEHTIQNCLVILNGVSGEYALSVESPDAPSIIMNNTIVNIGSKAGNQYGVNFVSSTANGHIFKDNIVANFVRGIANYRSAYTIDCDYNCVYNNDIDYFKDTGTGLVVGANNFDANPLFVNPVSDFHLQSGSPCIAAGTNLGIDTDLDGVARPDPPSVGAYEEVP